MSKKENALMTAMTMELKEVSACTKTAEFCVPAEAVKAEFAAVAKEFASQVQIGGFRKGKTPVSLVLARYGAKLAEDVERSIQRAAAEKVQDACKVVAIPDYKAKDDAKPAADKAFEFTFTVDIAPAFDLPAYADFEIEVPAQPSLEEEAEKELAYLKELYSDYATVEDPAANGDMLKVTYTSDFTPAEDASASLKRMAGAEDSWIWLSENDFVPGATAALTGAKTGDVKEFTAEFPADWRESGLAGKKVAYKFTVKEVQHKTPITDDKVLAEKLRMDDVEKMKEMLKKQAENKLVSERKSVIQEKLVAKLVEAVGAFDLPGSAVETEKRRIFSSIANNTVKSEADAEKFKADMEKHLADAEVEARKKLSRNFILTAIAEQEKVEVSPAEFDQHLEELAGYYRCKKQDIVKRLQENDAFGDFHADLVIGKTLDVLCDKVKVKEVK